MNAVSRFSRLHCTFSRSLLAVALATALYGPAVAEVGDPTGPDIAVFREEDAGHPRFHSVHADAQGGFVLVYSIDGPHGRRLLGQLYTRFGKPARSPALLLDGLDGPDAKIAMDAQGNVTLVYPRAGRSADTLALRARLFDGRLNRRRDRQLFVFKPRGAAEYYAPFAMDTAANGGFAVAYTHAPAAAAPEQVLARRFNADGSARGGPLQVNQTPSRNLLNPAIDMDADGDFVVGWDSERKGPHDDNPDFDPYVYIASARFIGKNGQPRSAEVSLLSVGEGTECDPPLSAVALDEDGDFVLASSQYPYCSYGRGYGVTYSTWLLHFTPDGRLLHKDWMNSRSLTAADFILPDVLTAAYDLIYYGFRGNDLVSQGYTDATPLPAVPKLPRFSFAEATGGPPEPFWDSYLAGFATDAGGNFIMARTRFLDADGQPTTDFESAAFHELTVSRALGPIGVSCFDAAATLVGTSGDDTLIGTAGDDIIKGLRGNDKIFGGGGNDAICGGADNDRIDGGPGWDLIQGDAGDDILLGGSGNDQLFGGPGDDQLFGNDGNDKLYGEAGSDRADGGPGKDRCYAESKVNCP